MPVLTITPFLL